MPSITPSLWFDYNLEAAARFYTSVFPDSHIEGFNRTTDAGPGEPGAVLSGTAARSCAQRFLCPLRSATQIAAISDDLAIGIQNTHPRDLRRSFLDQFLDEGRQRGRVAGAISREARQRQSPAVCFILRFLPNHAPRRHRR